MLHFKSTSICTVVFALILGISFSTSYAQETKTEKQPETYTLKVEVVDAKSGEVLPDVKVVIPGTGKELKKETGEEGTVAFEKLTAGTYTLKVNAEGYKPWEKEVDLTKDSRETVKLEPVK